MEVKEFLSQVFTLDQEIRAKQIEIQQLRDMRMNIGTTLSPDKVQSSRHIDRMGDISAMLFDLEDEYAKDVVRLLRLKYDVKMLIERVDNADYRALLSLRYVSLMKWEMIAVEMHYHYRWVHKLHGKALQDIESHYRDMI